jgi:hypothetical protein
VSDIKPGDLCRIVHSMTAPECIGWHVTAVRPYYDEEGDRCWFIQHAPFKGYTETRIPERWLRRVPPLDELEGEKREETVSA